jgi:hypothetical protein
MSYAFSGGPAGSRRILRGQCRSTITHLRDHAPTLEQEQLDLIGDTHLLAAVGEISDQLRHFITGLDGTHHGLAMQAAKLTSNRAKRELLDAGNFSGSEKRRKEFVEEKVNEEWYSRLDLAGKDTRVRIEEDWLSERRTIEITGVNFETLALKQIAGASMIWLASREALERSARAVHYKAHDTRPSLVLDRNLPRSHYGDRSEEYQYFSADGEDGRVEKPELHGYDDGKKRYTPSPDPRPDPKFF